MTSTVAEPEPTGWQVGAEKTLYVGVTGTVTNYDREAGIVTIGAYALPVMMKAWPDVRVHYLSSLSDPACVGNCWDREESVTLTRFHELRDRYIDAIRNAHEDRHGTAWLTCDDPLCRMAREDS